MQQGSVVRVPSIDAEPGTRLELRDVLLVSDGDRVLVGKPTVADALVVAQVVGHGRGEKVVNFKYKAKVRYRRKRGHRQPYTEIAVSEILTDGRAPTPPSEPAAVESAAEAPAAPRRRARAEQPAEEPAAPARRRRRPSSESETSEQE